jgi:hypothetical protein
VLASTFGLCLHTILHRVHESLTEQRLNRNLAHDASNLNQPEHDNANQLSTIMSNKDFVTVKGNKLVVNGETIILKGESVTRPLGYWSRGADLPGAAIGGWSEPRSRPKWDPREG